jgi:hypothetical protein
VVLGVSHEAFLSIDLKPYKTFERIVWC